MAAPTGRRRKLIPRAVPQAAALDAHGPADAYYRAFIKVLPRALALLVLVVVVLLSSIYMSWWLVGDLSETTTGSVTHIVAPPEISSGAARAIGIGCLVIGGTAAAGVLFGSAIRRREPGWRLVVSLVVVVGAIVGYGWRVLTAGTAGANQGAGLIVLVGAPVVLGLLATAGIRSFQLLAASERGRER